MTSFAELLSQGTGHAWLFVPAAILLGVMHGLEPGHSKTMMAAFIIAIRGTVKQAILLGLCATLSHTLIVWIIALGGLYLWQGLAPEAIEPYLQVGSALVIIALGGWMLWRIRHDYALASLGDHGHGHSHHDDSAHGFHDLDVSAGARDSHERAHANDIRRRFADRNVTTGQIVVFGLTGGLIPCPGAITVLLLCLQLKAFVLGAALVLCFSIGLALTMVTSGVIAAISMRHVAARFRGFGEVVRKAPYFSAALILLIGVYLGISGWMHLPG